LQDSIFSPWAPKIGQPHGNNFQGVLGKMGGVRTQLEMGVLRRMTVGINGMGVSEL